jgi:hypothetical protein
LTLYGIAIKNLARTRIFPGLLLLFQSLQNLHTSFDFFDIAPIPRTWKPATDKPRELFINEYNSDHGISIWERGWSLFASGVYKTTRLGVAFPLSKATLHDSFPYLLEAKML